MMSDVHGISGVLNKEQGLRGANSGERQVGLKAGFNPAVPRLVTFQSPPSVAEERGGSAAGGICPPPAKSNVEWGLRPALLPPAPDLSPSQRLPASPRRGGGPRPRPPAPP